MKICKECRDFERSVYKIVEGISVGCCLKREISQINDEYAQYDYFNGFVLADDPCMYEVLNENTKQKTK